ncbi:MAG: sialidase family protein [Polyangia bacterium]|jgi:hypothetical protein
MANGVYSLFVKLAVRSMFVVAATSVGCGSGSGVGPSKQLWSSVASSSDGTRLVAVSGGFDIDGVLTNGGYIYTSSDSGATWTQRTAPQQGWVSLASSSDGTKLVAVGNDSIYRSSDSGATWAQTGTQQLWSSVASSSDGTKLVAVGNDSIYRSSDSGTTWAQTGAQQLWSSVASSSDGTKLVAVVAGDHIYTSSDSGVTWTQTTAPQQDWVVRGVVIGRREARRHD